MKRQALTSILSILFLATMGAAQTPIQTEEVKELKRTGMLGTSSYAPTSQEKPFFDKLPAKEHATGSFMEPYDIHRKNDQYVSWYGVVRGISKVGGSQDTWQLLLEHKYFDGLTDSHIMLVSMSGSGDFLARLQGKDINIPPLALIRVYGTVKKDRDGTPVMTAEFVRVWPWMTFTFTDLGAEDKTNPRWKKECRLCKAGRIYNPYPEEDYYRNALGDPSKYGTALQ